MLNLISERLRTTSVKPSRRRPLFAYTWRDLGESSRLHCGVLRKLSVAARTIQRASGTLRRGRRCCDRTIAEIAARAGVCRTLVQSAIREAARQGLITVEERRREGQKNLPDVVRVVSRRRRGRPNLERGQNRAGGVPKGKRPVAARQSR